MFTKILVANRGEVAVRVIRACREMGIETVAVYSKADENSLPVALADERVCIGDGPASSSYLNMRNIIGAAEITGAQAIHPGYGFLSENANFAEACEKSGIVFIGPKSDVLRAMGDKDNARSLMKSIDVPTVPGTELIKDATEALRFAEEIGYPVLVKATAGGGGKGIRVAQSPDKLENELFAASEEAKSAFGDGGVFLEKYLVNVRHVEMQVLADGSGNVVCLGERDCSLQINKQKVLEETPCPVMSDDARQKMRECSVSAARAAGYTGAGTMEYLLDKDENFYFIEMNARLQVEHAVTEEVSGVDIVKWQIRIAAGMALDFKQDDIQPKGCSMECRINARSVGKIGFLHAPGGVRIHFDTALVQGAEVGPYYDSMLGKLVVYAPTREEAARKLETALCETVIHGVETNLDEQLRLVRDVRFKCGEYDTRFLQDGG